MTEECPLDPQNCFIAELLFAGMHDDRIVAVDGNRQVSAREFCDGVNRWRQQFSEVGLNVGDTIALVLTNRIEFFEILIAGLMSGISAAPINWHLQGEEVRSLLSLCDASAVYTESRFLHLLEKAGGCVTDVDSLAVSEHASTLAEVHSVSAAGRVILFTGGTSGLPKGVVRQSPASLAALFGHYRDLGRAIGLTGAGPHLIAGPLYHAAPLFYALYDFLNGAPLIVMPQWRAEDALRLIARWQIRATHFVPTQMVRLLRLDDSVKSRYQCDSLELVLHGAAATAPEIKRNMIEWMGPVFEEYWGGSESGVVTRISAIEWLQHPTSVGKPVRHYQVRIVDESTGEPLPAGELGVIQIRHSSGEVPFVYLGGSESVSPSAEFGWFDLGDLGSVDADGFLAICDRQKNKMICAGVNIYPAEIERQLLALGEVQDVVAFGLPDPEWGEVPVAMVRLCVPTNDANLKAINAQIVKQFDNVNRFIRPRQVFYVTDMPRMPNGKIRSVELLAIVRQQEYFAKINIT